MKNVLVLTYWSFRDPLIQTYTLPYVRIIRNNLSSKQKVYLFTMEQKFHEMSNVEWTKEKNKLAKENIVLLRSKYSHFGLQMLLKFIRIFLKLVFLTYTKKISVIHAWCTPGGAIGYILSLLTCKPLIIDSYEPHAESMVENGEWNKNSTAFKILFWLEKNMSKKSKTVIALTEGMREYAQKKYGATFNNYYVKPAMVNLDKFNFSIKKDVELVSTYGLKDKIVCLYAGKLGGIYLDNEVFDIFKIMYDHWGDKLKILLLTNTPISEIKEKSVRAKLPKNLIETLFVDFAEIHKYYALADFSINPVKPVPSKRYCTSIKDGEYWASGLPVIITDNISDDSDIIEKEDIGAVLKDLNEEVYEEAVLKIDNLLKGNVVELKNKIRSIAIKYRSFDIAENIYKEIYSI